MNTNSTQPETQPTVPVSPAPTTVEQPAANPSAAQPQARQGVSEDTKTLITVLLLIFVFPIGLIVMFFWPKWKWWVKLLVALPVLLIVFFILSAVVLVSVNPSEQIEKAECMTACVESGGTDCAQMCAAPEPTTDTDATVIEPVPMEAQ